MSKLILISGKIASGKYTLAAQLATKNHAILISQDQWLSKLYPEEIQNIEDYKKYFSRLREALAPLLIQVLKRNQSVVLDFPANTAKIRQWMKSVGEAAGCELELHDLDQ